MNGLLAKMLETISTVSTPFKLTAFAIVAMVLILWIARGKRPVSLALSFVTALTAGVLVLLPLVNARPDVYRVRVTVLDGGSVPVEDARVWSSVGGEPKKVAGGWQFDVPRSAVPSDRKLFVYATIANAFLSGQQEAELREDYSLTVRVTLVPNTSARVRGVVVDASGRGLSGVRVSVVGHESEAVITSDGGGFELPAHAADGQQVYLHAEKAGYAGVNLWHPAGNVPAMIQLARL